MNFNEDTTEPGSKDRSRGSSKKALAGTGAREFGSQDRVGEFFEFIRNDWREILAEVVAAGVTAYLATRQQTRSRRH